MEKVGPHVPTLVWALVIFLAAGIAYHRFVVAK